MVDAFRLCLDHSGAEALLAALELDSISDPELDDLLAVPGVWATVANTTKYLPDHTEAAFRTALRTWVETRQEPWGHFGFAFAAEHAAEVRELIAELEAQQGLIRDVLATLGPYLPSTGPLEVTVYSVVCGVSDGFVLDGQADPALFMALDRAQGDVQGVKLNMTHELYHTAQQAARARVPGLTAVTVEPGSASPVVRLLTTVLDEGTATWVARSMLDGDGPYLAMWRSAYERNARSESVHANFARFHLLLAALADGTMSWDDATAPDSRASARRCTSLVTRCRVRSRKPGVPSRSARTSPATPPYSSATSPSCRRSGGRCSSCSTAAVISSSSGPDVRWRECRRRIRVTAGH